MRLSTSSFARRMAALGWVGAAETFALARETVAHNPDSSDYAFLIVNAATCETLIEPPEKTVCRISGAVDGTVPSAKRTGLRGNAKPVPTGARKQSLEQIAGSATTG
jgi:hypothetical protein